MPTRLQRLAAALAQGGYDAYLALQRPNQLYLIPATEPVSALPPVPFILFGKDAPLVFPGPAFYYACRDALTGCEIAKTEVGDPDVRARLVEALAARNIRRLVSDPLPPDLAAELQRSLPGLTLVEDRRWGAHLRRTKEPQELALLREAARIADLGMAAAFAAARPGVSGRAIAAEAAAVMLRAGCEEAGLQVAVGPATAYMGTGNWVSEPRRKLQAGDLLLVDMAILYHGYLGDQTRTAIVGEGTPAQRALIETVQAAYRATRDAMRPGARSADLYAITVAMLEAKGWRRYFPHHISHGLGLGGDLPRVALDADDTLQEGDALSCEPGVYIPGLGGARFENMLVITATGAEELTRSPWNPTPGG
ncbi:MAG TPA: Xaa-Pro peptidase family protein [Caldilineaceae bacterium]|nr:Xaa-Pro peptidase family protein [Caldilineaceae bacterium]